jgi:hypothetical protein
MALDAKTIRSHIPIPPIRHPLIGWALFLLGAVVLFDSYQGGGPWPASTLFPW